MAKTSTLAALLSVSLLVACGSPKDASKENFRKVIDGVLAKECAASVSPRYQGNFPATIGNDFAKCYGKQGQETQEALDANFRPLVKAGLLSVSDGERPSKVKHGSCNVGEIAPTKIFTPTELGKKYLTPDGSGNVNSFCVGHYKVDEIVRFTEPNNVLGRTMSEVIFTVRANDIADWAKSPDLQKVKENNVFGADRMRVFQATHGVERKKVLYLTSDGWRDADEISLIK